MLRMGYNVCVFVGGLAFAFLPFSSFGSNYFTQEEPQEKIRTAATTPQIAIPFSAESTLSHDVRVHILSLLSQDDLLRMGTVSKSWRKAASTVWQTHILDLSHKKFLFGRGFVDAPVPSNAAVSLPAIVFDLIKDVIKASLQEPSQAHYKILTHSIFPHIKIANCNLQGKEASILAASPIIKSLDLKNNQIGKSITGIKALMKIPTLTYLDLSRNQLDVQAGIALSEALVYNSTLRTLHLAFNDIQARGVAALAVALKSNTALTSLNLGWTRLGDEGAKVIARALPQNMTLTTVDLSEISIGDEGTNAIAVALKGNKILTTVNLRGNSISDEGKKALEDLKRSRPSLDLKY